MSRRFYGTFLRTDALTAGMMISTKDGDGVTVITVDKTETQAPTYNLTVANAHTFFVGDDGIWVHNVDCTIGPNGFVDSNIEGGFQRFKDETGLDISREDWINPDRFVAAANGHNQGPGLWATKNEKSGVGTEWESFQSTATGSPPGTVYNAGGKAFDGFDANTGDLLDAKCFSCGPNGWPDPSKPFSETSVLNDAVSSSAAAARAGRPLRWIVPTPEKANQLNDLFRVNPNMFGGLNPPTVVSHTS